MQEFSDSHLFKVKERGPNLDKMQMYSIGWACPSNKIFKSPTCRA